VQEPYARVLTLDAARYETALAYFAYFASCHPGNFSTGPGPSCLRSEVRDSDLTFGQYAEAALIFGALGAGVGLVVDALFHRAIAVPRERLRRIVIAPRIWRDVRGVAVKCRW
jgi:hypothetical protein